MICMKTLKGKMIKKERKPLHEECATPYECLKKLICQNKGTQCAIMKEDLIKLAEKNKVNVKKSDTKEIIFVNLSKVMPIEEIAAKCNIGVRSIDIQRKFSITGAQVKQMASHGLFHVTGKERFYAYGRTITANLYSIFDFYKLGYDEVYNWLSQNTKAY